MGGRPLVLRRRRQPRAWGSAGGASARFSAPPKQVWGGRRKALRWAGSGRSRRGAAAALPRGQLGAVGVHMLHNLFAPRPVRRGSDRGPVTCLSGGFPCGGRETPPSGDGALGRGRAAPVPGESPGAPALPSPPPRPPAVSSPTGWWPGSRGAGDAREPGRGRAARGGGRCPLGTDGASRLAAGRASRPAPLRSGKCLNTCVRENYFLRYSRWADRRPERGPRAPSGPPMQNKIKPLSLSLSMIFIY